MVGKLQTNKVKTALKIFDYIHSVDNYKLAEKIVKYEKELDKKIKTFVQVNIGEESQKNGISPNNIIQFVNHCIQGSDRDSIWRSALIFEVRPVRSRPPLPHPD